MRILLILVLQRKHGKEGWQAWPAILVCLSQLGIAGKPVSPFWVLVYLYVKWERWVKINLWDLFSVLTFHESLLFLGSFQLRILWYKWLPILTFSCFLLFQLLKYSIRASVPILQVFISFPSIAFYRKYIYFCVLGHSDPIFFPFLYF